MLEKIYRSKKSTEIQNELEAMDVDFVQQPYQVSQEVPTGFWKKQRTDVIQKVGAKEKTGGGVIQNYRRLFYFTSAAAMLLLLIWISSGSEVVSESDLNFDSIELSALEEYLLDEAGNLDVRLSLEETFYDQELWMTVEPQKESND